MLTLRFTEKLCRNRSQRSAATLIRDWRRSAIHHAGHSNSAVESTAVDPFPDISTQWLKLGVLDHLDPPKWGIYDLWQPCIINHNHKVREEIAPGYYERFTQSGSVPC